MKPGLHSGPSSPSCLRASSACCARDSLSGNGTRIGSEMYWRLAYQMLEKAERAFDVLWYDYFVGGITPGLERLERLHLSVLRRILPSLEIIEDDEEALRAVTVDSMGRWWRRPALVVPVLFGLPMLWCIVLLFGSLWAGILPGVTSEIVLGLISGTFLVLGFVLTYLPLWIIGVLRARRTLHRVIAELGHAICPSCSYDLRVHATRERRSVICPECGSGDDRR